MKENSNPKVEDLKEMLKSYGIQTEGQLDKALSDSLEKLEVGIMTRQLPTLAPEKTA